MIAEIALSAVASLLILQSLFLLRVATKTSEESSQMRTSDRTERIAVVDPTPHALNLSSQATTPK
jgi:hypothetical protein